MGSLTCVRHGQASFGAANYDQLSPLGERQAERLGTYLAPRWVAGVLRFDALLTGTLARHNQTAAGMRRGLLPTADLQPNTTSVQVYTTSVATFFDDAESTEALNEYDSEALIHAQLLADPPAAPLPAPRTPEGYKAHFRVLRSALKAWIAGELNPQNMPTFAQFRAGIAGVAERIAAEPQKDWLIVSSGGPISTLVMHVLKAEPLAMIELNYQMKNTAVTRFHLSPGKLHLSGFNALPHLDDAAFADWITSA